MDDFEDEGPVASLDTPIRRPRAASFGARSFSGKAAAVEIAQDVAGTAAASVSGAVSTLHHMRVSHDLKDFFACCLHQVI
jgi:hypothetical protein